MDNNLHLAFGFWPLALLVLTGTDAGITVGKASEANKFFLWHPSYDLDIIKSCGYLIAV
jgi:hypothetical protein